MVSKSNIWYLVKLFGNNQSKQSYLKEVLVSISVMNFYILELLFSAIFLYTCYNSIKKYINSMVAIAIQESEISEVEYPSVRNSFQKQGKLNHCFHYLIYSLLVINILKSISVYVWIMSTRQVLIKFSFKMIPSQLMT